MTNASETRATPLGRAPRRRKAAEADNCTPADPGSPSCPGPWGAGLDGGCSAVRVICPAATPPRQNALPRRGEEAVRPQRYRLARQAPAAPSCHARRMREKELRIALVCYGGVSLAVYMHGITKEIWRLAKASQRSIRATVRDPEPRADDVYSTLLAPSRPEADTDMRDHRRHPRRRQRGRDQRHLPRPRHRHRPGARSADRPLARFGRCRRPDRRAAAGDLRFAKYRRGPLRLGAVARARGRSTRRSSPRTAPRSRPSSPISCARPGSRRPSAGPS